MENNIENNMNPFYMEVYRGIEDYAGENGYTIVLSRHFDHSIVKQRQYDGIILSGISTEMENEFINLGIPVVVTDYGGKPLHLPSVGIDIKGGAQKATDREFTSLIVEKLAVHYCSHPAIIGWQIDNELNCETNVFYSEADHAAFRNYLKKKFKTLDALNEAMGTIFWNQTYTSWDELYLTRSNINDSNNPHLSLEEKRFFSESTISFCKLQCDIIRKYAPIGQFITTNGIFGHLDSHEMTDTSLDFITFDSYPNFAFDTGTEPKKPGNLNDRRSSWSLTRTRSISPNFGIMEQQSSGGGWDIKIKQPAPKPGQMRLWTFQSIAHGADFISYFRWRTCWIGTEIYWHGLNDYSNQPNRRLDKVLTIKIFRIILSLY